MKTRKKVKLVFLFVMFVTGALSFNACAPVFSELQTAKTLDEGETRITPTATNTNFVNDGESEHVMNQFGLLVDYGISKKTNLRFKYEAMFMNINDSGIFDYNDFTGFSHIGLGIKLALIEDKLAINLPMSANFSHGRIGDDVEGIPIVWLQFQPSIIFTQQIIPEVLDFSIAPKMVIGSIALIPLMAINVNFGINVSETVRIMPEYGVMFYPNQSGYFPQLSVGLGIKLNR